MNLTSEALIGNGAMIGHASYVLLIASMLMTRMVWLRILAIGSGVLAAVYSAFWLDDPVSVFWEMLFVLTNVGQLTITSYLNRRTRFTTEERTFYEIAVPGLEPAHARQLLQAGRWVDAEPGAVLTRQGERVSDLVFITSGEARVEVDGQLVGSCATGDFVGEISVSTGIPATATVTAVAPIRYLAFERGVLMKLLGRSSEIAQAVELSYRHGLRDKLIRANMAMAKATGGSTQ